MNMTASILNKQDITSITENNFKKNKQLYFVFSLIMFIFLHKASFKGGVKIFLKFKGVATEKIYFIKKCWSFLFWISQFSQKNFAIFNFKYGIFIFRNTKEKRSYISGIYPSYGVYLALVMLLIVAA
ncbi:MAG: hypothetical protein Ct9H300mP28_14200 [Pseudomonadota bacterium]|nr:MAG: hypothetical protein Ct9H300mP28_14200 [Pseudomonadota bacterium]